MKYFLSLIVLLSTILLLSSCSDTDIITESNSEDIDNSSLYKSIGPSVSGQATVQYPWEDDKTIYSFHAQEDKNGVVSGTVQVLGKGTDSRGHGIVTCLKIIGDNEAIFSGEYTKGEVFGDEIQVPAYFWIHVIDDGEGMSAQDQFVDWIDFDTPFDCDDFPSGFIVDVIGGNVQVRP